jgi:hypothetical protein
MLLPLLITSHLNILLLHSHSFVSSFHIFFFIQSYLFLFPDIALHIPVPCYPPNIHVCTEIHKYLVQNLISPNLCCFTPQYVFPIILLATYEENLLFMNHSTVTKITAPVYTFLAPLNSNLSK